MAADNFKTYLGGSASRELPFRIDCGRIGNKTEQKLKGQKSLFFKPGFGQGGNT